LQPWFNDNFILDAVRKIKRTKSIQTTLDVEHVMGDNSRKLTTTFLALVVGFFSH